MDTLAIYRFKVTLIKSKFKGASLSKLSSIIDSGREIETSDLSALTTREIYEEAWVIVERPQSPSEVLASLVFHPDVKLRAALARHSNSTDELLGTLLLDESNTVRRIADRRIAKRRPLPLKFVDGLRGIFRLLRRSGYGIFKLFAAYMILSMCALVFTDTATFVKAVNGSNEEMKAYAVCTLSFQVLDPTLKDFSSCEPFRRVGESKARKIASTEFIDGECPAGYKLESGIHLPNCVKQDE